jgi:hypothetical protein
MSSCQPLSRPEFQPESSLGLLLILDAIRLCAQLTVMVADDNQYKKMMALRGPAAQNILNLLQAVYDSLLLILYLYVLIMIALGRGCRPGTQASPCQSIDQIVGSNRALSRVLGSERH